eukprot:363237-Chlamydomonas_euryale.AAC.4
MYTYIYTTTLRLAACSGVSVGLPILRPHRARPRIPHAFARDAACGAALYPSTSHAAVARAEGLPPAPALSKIRCLVRSLLSSFACLEASIRFRVPPSHTSRLWSFTWTGAQARPPATPPALSLAGQISFRLTCYFGMAAGSTPAI